MDELSRIGKAFAKELARELARELRSANDEWVSQIGSPLGNRRHCAAVRGRVERGDVNASIVRGPEGKRFLLTKEALREELTGLNRPLAKAVPQPAVAGNAADADDVRCRLLRKLGRA